MANECYVYAILVDGVVRYIGKGRGNRAFQHARVVRSAASRIAKGERLPTRYFKHRAFYAKLLDALNGGSNITEAIIASSLSDDDAFAVEVSEIQKVNSVQLWNVLDGGEGATPESQRKMWAEPGRRLARSEEMKKRWSDPEFASRMRKAKTSPEVIAKQRASAIKNWADPEWRKRNADGMSRPDVRARRVESAKAQHANPEMSARLYSANRDAQKMPGLREMRIGWMKSYWKMRKTAQNGQAAIAAKPDGDAEDGLTAGSPATASHAAD